MAVQGFFSPDRKTRMAGERENNATFSVKVEPVKVANNVNQYNEQTPTALELQGISSGKET